jgi:hypothetical protein
MWIRPPFKQDFSLIHQIMLYRYMNSCISILVDIVDIRTLLKHVVDHVMVLLDSKHHQGGHPKGILLVYEVFTNRAQKTGTGVSAHLSCIQQRALAFGVVYMEVETLGIVLFETFTVVKLDGQEKRGLVVERGHLVVEDLRTCFEELFGT